jgi:hypothetical protein
MGWFWKKWQEPDTVAPKMRARQMPLPFWFAAVGTMAGLAVG